MVLILYHECYYFLYKFRQSSMKSKNCILLWTEGEKKGHLSDCSSLLFLKLRYQFLRLLKEHSNVMLSLSHTHTKK